MQKMVYSSGRGLQKEGSGLSHLPPPHPPQVLGRRCVSGSSGGSWPLSAGSAGCCVGPSECGPHLDTAGGSSWPPPSPVGSEALRCAGSGPLLFNTHTHRILNLSGENETISVKLNKNPPSAVPWTMRKFSSFSLLTSSSRDAVWNHHLRVIFCTFSWNRICPTALNYPAALSYQPFCWYLNSFRGSID